ncbi:MAG: FAD-dependent monooxygenase [bacterium]|nr:FAD-dependent monooxygenase [bacterium]
MAEDVVIVGGGPAGSALALRLARAGASVRIVERAAFPRTKVCGEYLSPGALAELEALGVAQKVTALAAPLRGIRLYAARGDPLTLPFDGGVALALERRVLDARLLAAAREAGAVCEHARAEELILEDGRAAGVRVRDPGGELQERRAGVVVGADGIGSMVARRLGLTRQRSSTRERFALGGHVVIGAGECEWLSMFSAGGAYFAVNPLGPRRANVMLVLARRELAAWGGRIDAAARRRVERLVGGRAPLDLFPARQERLAAGPLAQRVCRVHAPGALLVGDAAGFLNPFTGQGVWLALEGAREAAAAILALLRGECSESAAWRAYARARDTSWRPRRVLSGVMELLQLRDAWALHAVARACSHREAARTLLGACAGTIPARAALHPLVLGRLLA